MKVDILICSYRSAPTSATHAIMAMHNRAREAGVDLAIRLYGNALVHRARNTALATVRPDADFALFVDDDMLPPEDALLQLIDRNVPVVSALCTTRVQPITIAAKVYDEASDQFIPLDRANLGKMITGKFGVGTAFFLIRRDAIEAMTEYFLTARDWMEENRRTFDRLHVRAEWREKERARREEVRRANYSREKHLRVFDYMIAENEMQLGEDITFSRRVIKNGIPVSIDGTCVVGHIGEYPYSVWDVIRAEQEDAESLIEEEERLIGSSLVSA